VGAPCVVWGTVDELVVAAGGVGAGAHEADSSAAAARTGADRNDMAGAYAGGKITDGCIRPRAGDHDGPVRMTDLA
jgi:hypothetical protein